MLFVTYLLTVWYTFQHHAFINQTPETIQARNLCRGSNFAFWPNKKYKTNILLKKAILIEFEKSMFLQVENLPNKVYIIWIFLNKDLIYHLTIVYKKEHYLCKT